VSINWKEVLKFLSGAFFVGAGVNWYLSWYNIGVPFFGFMFTPKIMEIRGFVHFVLFLICFYWGFIKK
jgi:hypothetical protein